MLICIETWVTLNHIDSPFQIKISGIFILVIVRKMWVIVVRIMDTLKKTEKDLVVNLRPNKAIFDL